MKIITVILITIILALSVATPHIVVADTTSAECWALIIGVADYQNYRPAPYFTWPLINYDLNYADDEALNIHNTLSPIWGETHIKLLVDSDASKAGIESAMLDWLAPQEEHEDTVLLYFAGHGNSSYLCPYDSSETSYTNDISTSTLGSWLNALDSERIVVILDSCGSGGFAEDLATSGRVILAATYGDKDAWEYSDLRSGVFGYYLLDGIKQISSVDTNGNGMVSAEELFQYAKLKVINHDFEDEDVQYEDVQNPQMFDGFIGELNLFSIVTEATKTSKIPIFWIAIGCALLLLLLIVAVLTFRIMREG